MSSMKCSMCGKVVEREGNLYAPFCSERCQNLDLGNWLDERYGLPWDDPSRETEADRPDVDDDEHDSTER